jgi:ComF family protein
MDSINNCLFFAQNCILCDRQCSAVGSICKDCWSDLPWQTQTCKRCAIIISASNADICKDCLKKKPHFDHTIAAFNYLFPIDIILPKIKKQQARHHMKWLTQALASKIIAQQNLHLPQAIIPVPLSNIKQLIKGYNQTEQLCLELNKLLHIDINTHLVKKTKETPSQAKLKAKERKKNLINAFCAKKTPLTHVAIVDDVMTTGATANEIAKELKKVGVKKVDLWILARTLI